MSWLLNPPGIGVGDHAPGLFPHAHPDWPQNVRLVADGLSEGLTDREIWERFFADEKRIRLHKTLYGNRPKRRKRHA